jgi:hypothetical protein
MQNFNMDKELCRMTRACEVIIEEKNGRKKLEKLEGKQQKSNK